MRRNLTSLLLGLTMAFALVGCSSGHAPDVTPTPNNTVMPSSTPHLDKDTGKPDVSDDAHYDANTDGKVEGTASPEGSVTRAMDEAGDTVRRAVDETGDAVRDTVDRAVH